MKAIHIPAYGDQLSQGVWSRLPSELAIAILRVAAKLSPRTARKLRFLSREYKDLLDSFAFDTTVLVRDRTRLIELAYDIHGGRVRPEALTNLYVSNKFDSSHTEGDKEQVLYRDRHTGPREKRRIGFHWSDYDPEKSEELDLSWLYQETPEALDSPASEESIKDLPAAALIYIFRRCINLQYLHVWEPFTLGYPEELSNLGHLAPYPLELIHKAFSANLGDPGAKSNIFIKELTISSLAIRPSDFDRLRHSHSTLPPGSKDETTASALDELESLHLHWPTLSLKDREQPSADNPVPVLSTSSLGANAEFHPDTSSSHIPPAQQGTTTARIENGFFAHTRNQDARSAGDTHCETLLEALLTLPNLRRLRLTRPSPTGLVSGTRTLLEQAPKLDVLFIELGWYIDHKPLQDLKSLEEGYRSPSAPGRPRLILIGKERDRKRWNGGWLQWDEDTALHEFHQRTGGTDTGPGVYVHTQAGNQRKLFCDWHGRGAGCWDSDEES